MNQDAILARKAGRIAFEEAAELVSDESEAFREGFYRAALEAGRERCDAVDTSTMMDEQEAAEHDAKQVGFGMHSLLKWYDVPLSYLTNHAKNCKVFLRWYNSDRVQRRIRRED